MKITNLLLLAFLLLQAGCGFADREQELRDKDVALTQKEHELRMLEKNLALKETEILKREALLDSSRKTWDSIGVYNEMLVGEWNVKMNCTETNCEGSAIGDTKTEQWEIAYENNRVVARAFSKKKLVRIYEGIYSGSMLKLSEEEQVTETQMLVELIPDPKATHKMKGTRMIVQPTCKIRYDLEMERISDRKNITNIIK